MSPGPERKLIRVRSRPDQVRYIKIIDLLNTGEGPKSEGPVDPEELLASIRRLKEPHRVSSWLKRK